MANLNKNNLNKIVLSVVVLNVIISFFAGFTPVFQSLMNLVSVNMRAMFGHIPTGAGLNLLEELLQFNIQMIRVLHENYIVYCALAFGAFCIVNTFIIARLFIIYLITGKTKFNKVIVNNEYSKSTFTLNNQIIFNQPNCVMLS